MKRSSIFFFSIILIFTLLLSGIKLSAIYNIPQNFGASYSEIENADKRGYFGNFIKADMETEQTQVGSEKEGKGKVVFKLFGFIPIRKVEVNILPEEEVYVGGVPIGLTVNTRGAVIVSDTTVDMANEKVEINKSKFFKSGDIIKSINDMQIHKVDDVEKALQTANNDEIEVEYVRNNTVKHSKVKLVKNQEGNYRLGVWARDDISGVGTLTFVDKDNNFAALGHAITDGNSGNVLPITSGQVYDCSLLGINKGKKNAPGELRCVFLQQDEKGTITDNTKFGIHGHLTNLENLIDTNVTMKIGGRLSVTPGKAKIISNVSGIREEYEIEIIKANYQSRSGDKSIVFRVKDKRLIALTGGIVQGMSGSPIVQNGKIVGAVTHVFLADATKGYGVYSDWILDSMQA